MRRLLPKPWFIWRPTQIGRRLLAGATMPPAGFAPFPVAWGGTIVADGSKVIGRSLRTIGTYDLAVSETLGRLLRPGDVAVDAGANVGYMSVLMATVVGASGRVTAFEPHPELFQVLRRNLGANHVADRVDARHAAVGATSGHADLVVPGDFAANDGLAHVAQAGESRVGTVRVPLERLDDLLGSTRVDVLKMDVEGYELQVLEGGATSFAAGRIRHVVFEDHVGAGSPVVQRLREWGFAIFSLGWKLTGLCVIPVERGYATSRFEAPSYLATLDQDRAALLASGRGWRTLRRLPAGNQAGTAG